MEVRRINAEDKVYVRCEHYPAGRTEDGDEYEAQGFVAIIERPDGQRLAHFKLYEGVNRISVDDPECGPYTFFSDIRKQAKFEANKLVDNIKKVGVVNLKYWGEVDPAYGSDYYCYTRKF